MSFPAIRPRRLRHTPALRRMVQETTLSPSDFIYPLFIQHGENRRIPISSMPGQFRLSVDQLAGEAAELKSLGVPAVVLFGIPAHKDPVGLENFASIILGLIMIGIIIFEPLGMYGVWLRMKKYWRTWPF